MHDSYHFSFSSWPLAGAFHDPLVQLWGITIFFKHAAKTLKRVTDSFRITIYTGFIQPALVFRNSWWIILMKF